MNDIYLAMAEALANYVLGGEESAAGYLARKIKAEAQRYERFAALSHEFYVLLEECRFTKASAILEKMREVGIADESLVVRAETALFFEQDQTVLDRLAQL